MIRRSSRRSRDGGFTLPELLITVAITGIVVSVLASAMITFLRNQDSASDRIDQTRGLQQLVNYFPQDVASAQTVAVSLDEASMCGTGGTPRLHLSWNERFGVSEITGSVTYREFGGAENQLTRFACDTDGTATSVVVARGFDWLEVNSATFSDGQVLLTIQFPEARRTIVAQSRNLSGDLS